MRLNPLFFLRFLLFSLFLILAFRETGPWSTLLFAVLILIIEMLVIHIRKCTNTIRVMVQALVNLEEIVEKLKCQKSH